MTSPVFDRSEDTELAREVLSRLQSGHSLRELRLGEVDGRVDLRGVSGPLTKVKSRHEVGSWFAEVLGEKPRLSSVELVDLDFSGAFLPDLGFSGCRIVNCRFDRAVCDRWGLWHSEVSQTSFAHSSLKSAVLGPSVNASDTTYADVSFANADMRKAMPGSAVYERCDFSDARLDGVHFQGSTLVQCRFAGLLEGTIFDRTPLGGEQQGLAEARIENTDFSATNMLEVEFRGFDLSSTTLPSDQNLIVLRPYRQVLEQIAAQLEAMDPNLNEVRYAHQMIGRWLHLSPPGQEVGLIDPRSFYKGPDDSLGSFLRTVLKAAASDEGGTRP